MKINSMGRGWMVRWGVLGLLGLATLPSQAAEPAMDKHAVMKGEWEFKTEGKSDASLTTTTTLTYDTGKKTFEGFVLGWGVSGTKLISARPGDRVRFTTVHELNEMRKSIDWKGVLSEDGQTITGEFIYSKGKGTFTATRKP
ncbi:MAG: hypothetical protein U1E27_10060 [Kiritimatiellia bacterium]|nr:hypothetical protein [Kiritimatiellia bacterium]